ncbi:MAG: hypothetical protein NWP61_01710 [Rickettsiaceae bacterium]|nr:hypothetical protein [Rickettsiaceae bacterium]
MALRIWGTLEECAIRETKEEAGVVLVNSSFFSITNDIFVDKNKHYKWEWFDIDKLPVDLLLPLKNLMNNKENIKKILECKK